MSTIFRKNLCLQNIRRYKTLLRSVNRVCVEKECFRPNTYLREVSRQQSFATAAITKLNHEILENAVDPINSNNVTLQDVEKAIVDVDFGVKRTGRSYKEVVENILSLIDKLSSASEVHGLYLLRSCGVMHMEKPSERVQLASVIWEKLHKLDVQLDIRHYNSLLKVFVDCDHPFMPSEFLASMESSKIEPNKATYLLLMQKYCNDGNLSEAGEILQCLKVKGLPINEAVFTILIKGHMRAGDDSGAKDILEVMRSANLSPTAESYTALACGYAEKGNIDDLNSIMIEASNNNIEFSNKHLLDIISSFTDAKNAKIDELLDQMSEVDVWRHEIVNAMMNLVYKEMDDIAFKLLCKIANPENNSANFFLKVLVKNDYPDKKIISYCHEVNERNLHNFAFMNTARAAMDFGKIDLALTLYETLEKRGVPVRNHNWQLLLSSFKDQDKAIFKALKKMCDMGVPIEFNTYFEYVFPAVSVSNPDDVIFKVKETGQSVATAIDALFQFYCYHSKFDNALYLTKHYTVSLHPSFYIENYIDSCRNLKNYPKACVKVLSFLLKNVKGNAKDSEVAQAVNLATLIEKNPSLYEALLSNSDEKFGLSEKSLNICASLLRRKNPNSLRYLRRLGNTGDQSSDIKTSRSSTEDGKETSLLRNPDRLKMLIEDFDRLGAEYPPTVLATLLFQFCQSNDLEKAEKCYNLLKEQCPTFVLDSLKVINYATLLVKYSKFDDAVNVIKTGCQELRLFGQSESSFSRWVKNLLNIAVETGNCDLVKSLEDLLSPHAGTLLTPDLLYEPLVKMHILKNDLDSAIDEFEKCVKNHRFAPCLKLLMKKCIKTESTTKLDYVVNTASIVIGKLSVLYDLTTVFLESKRRSEALKLMENLKNKSYSLYLEEVCFQMYNQKRIFDLLELVNLLWAVNHIDRETIVQHLLKLSGEQKDSKLAQDLYSSVKAYRLSDELKESFSNTMSKNGQQYPSTAFQSDISNFRQHLNEKDAHQALRVLQSMKKGVVRTIDFKDMTNFLDLVIESKILHDLSQNVNAMSYMIENCNQILKPLLEKYSSSGNTESLIEITNVFPDFTLKKISFNIYFSQAFISAEKHEKLLSELESRWNTSNKLFSIYAFEELLNRPALEERVINLAKKYLEDNFNLPIAVVWANFLIKGRNEDAEAFSKSFSVSVEKVDSIILRAVRQQENVNLGMSYISIINNSDASQRCKERIYGTVLDVLVVKEMYDNAASLVVEAQQKDLDLAKHYRSTLITLKNALEREKKPVPFSTPAEVHDISE